MSEQGMIRQINEVLGQIHDEKYLRCVYFFASAIAGDKHEKNDERDGQKNE